MSLFKPVELYTFRTTFDQWRYNDGRLTRTVSGVQFEPLTINRTEIDRSISDNTTKIIVPDSIPLAAMFLPSMVASPIYVDIHDYLDSVSLGAIRLTGRVLGHKFEVDRRELELDIIGISKMIRANIPNETFATHCQNDLGDDRCQVDLDDFKVSFPHTEATIDSLTVTHSQIGTKPDGHFSGGFVKIGSEFAYITKHVGTTIWLLNRLTFFTADMMEVFEGCPKSPTACDVRFGNKVNFGGHEFAPRENPVTGTVV